MKYLLKIPLLAISMACNRSAHEIKMIAASRPTTASAASPRPPPTTAILQLPRAMTKDLGPGAGEYPTLITVIPPW